MSVRWISPKIAGRTCVVAYALVFLLFITAAGCQQKMAEQPS